MKDIVYTRKYTDQKGQERKEYITVGYMFEKDGRISILMKPWINPAALQNEKGEVWLGVYDHKVKGQESQKIQSKPQENQLYGVEPTVATVAEVINEGKQYAEKWKEMAETKKSQETDDIPF